MKTLNRSFEAEVKFNKFGKGCQHVKFYWLKKLAQT
jgi:hypothetical protein